MTNSVYFNTLANRTPSVGCIQSLLFPSRTRGRLIDEMKQVLLRVVLHSVCVISVVDTEIMIIENADNLARLHKFLQPDEKLLNQQKEIWDKYGKT